MKICGRNGINLAVSIKGKYQKKTNSLLLILHTWQILPLTNPIIVCDLRRWTFLVMLCFTAFNLSKKSARIAPYISVALVRGIS